MSELSGFKTPEQEAKYLAAYDDLVARTWPVPHDELDVATRFGQTRVRRSGPAEGSPLVLIHPTTGSSLGWRALVEALTQHRPVYTPDTIGTPGRSVQTAPVRSIGDLVCWLDDVLDALGLDRIHLGGYSEGGWIAASHASLTERRDRLETLTLIEPGGAIERISPWMVAQLIFRAMRTLRAKDQRQALRAFNRWMNGDIDLTDDELDLVLLTFRAYRQRLPRPNRLSDDEVRQISMPTLLFIGSDTRIYDPTKVEARARRLLPDVQIEVIEGAGHGLAMQHPARVTGRITEFVDAADRVT